jgi:hypothetical protein
MISVENNNGILHANIDGDPKEVIYEFAYLVDALVVSLDKVPVLNILEDIIKAERSGVLSDIFASEGRRIEGYDIAELIKQLRAEKPQPVTEIKAAMRKLGYDTTGSRVRVSSIDNIRLTVYYDEVYFGVWDTQRKTFVD